MVFLTTSIFLFSATLTWQVFGYSDIGIEKINDVGFAINYFSDDAKIGWTGLAVPPHTYHTWIDTKHFSNRIG